MDAITTIHKLELEQPSQTAIVSLTGIDRSTTATVLRAMETAGLVKRARSKQDARAMVLSLTAAGRSKADLAKRAMRAAEEQVTARVKGLDKLRIVQEPAAEKPTEQRVAA